MPRATRLQTMEGTLEVRDGEVRLNDEVVATRPSSGSTVWGPVTLYPVRTDVEGAEITGRLKQASSYPVYVSRSKITATREPTNAFYQIDTRSRKGGVKIYLADCTIWGGLGNAAAFGGWMEFLRCDISGGENAIDMQTETHLRDCFVHGLERREGSHNDVLQCGGAVNASVIHCTLLAARRVPDGQGLEFPDGWYDPMNAVLMIGDYGGEVRNVTVEDCLVNGGNLTFNNNWRGNHPVTKIYVRRNRFGRHFRYGPKSLKDAPTDPDPPTWIWEDNVWDDTSESV